LAVNTRKVKGRRTVRYDTFEDIVADGQQLAAVDVVSLGNWSLGQTLAHLGSAMEGSITGKPFTVPMWLRVLGRVYLRRRLVYGPFPPGFQLPQPAAARLVHPEATPAEGLEMLRHGIARLRTDSRRIAHPVAGALSVGEWDSFHLRHAEMHMSFIVPKAAAQ
jgi:hypothetical protein